jgi:hypothetical protein
MKLTFGLVLLPTYTLRCYFGAGPAAHRHTKIRLQAEKMAMSSKSSSGCLPSMFGQQCQPVSAVNIRERNGISHIHARASSKQAWESMASSSENVCPKTHTVAMSVVVGLKWWQNPWYMESERSRERKSERERERERAPCLCLW